ncbi:MAG: pyridoxamine 5'-phosphate oxidase family protein [Deltaproteobacteria bacterium]|nr:pyridoxamine 5'-phosphate oxidase family protein [Deltaproteobacteria bacterium]
MDLKEYFKGAKGRGVLATADSQGRVDAAVYAKPHFMEDGRIAFIMADRLTHHNMQSNDKAAYLFMEEGPRYKGVRLFLTKLGEEKDTELLHSLRRRKYATEKGAEEGSRFLVFFRIDKVLPLVGTGEKKAKASS